MRTIMARSPLESSFSFSKRHFQRIIKKVGGESERKREEENGQEEEEVVEETLAFTSASSRHFNEEEVVVAREAIKKKKRVTSTRVAVSKFRSVLMSVVAGKNYRPPGLGHHITGTLFGYRRGHAHLAFQVDSKSCPVVLIELATPTGGLVLEMASGQVRIALECDMFPRAPSHAWPMQRAHVRVSECERKIKKKKKAAVVEEPLWRMYCNGKKCGYAFRHECGEEDWRVLRAVEPVSMGAGVLPSEDGGGSEGELMYIRARFERVVGSSDSEAFYMMSPDGNGGPELSVYLLRV